MFDAVFARALLCFELNPSQSLFAGYIRINEFIMQITSSYAQSPHFSSPPKIQLFSHSCSAVFFPLVITWINLELETLVVVYYV